MIAKLTSSLTLKLFLVSFTSTHLPLAAATAYYACNAYADPTVVAALLVAATVAGTAICLSALWLLLRPLTHLRAAILEFGKSRTLSNLRSIRTDEIGLITNAFTDLTSELERSISKLERQATSDSLTGLRNRRWLVENVTAVISRAKRDAAPLSVVVIDLDHFKSINDTYGHDIGDKALTAAGAVILACVRPYDLTARVGGEEFVIVLPGCDYWGANEIANRIRTRIAAAEVLPDHARLTASFGVYEADPAAETFSTMLKHADSNLYRAKRAGRNRVLGSSARNHVAEQASL